jgi:hypothetical protein
VPGIVSTSKSNGGMHTRADTLLPSMRYGSHIDVNQASVTLEKLDIRSRPLHSQPEMVLQLRDRPVDNTIGN